MNRHDWLYGQKRIKNFCDVCGEDAGNINGICAACLNKQKKGRSLADQLIEYSNVMTPADTDARAALIARALTTERGLANIARNLANPVRHNLDYGGAMRRSIRVDEGE